MKRLISGAEAAQAGLLGIAGWPVVAAMMPLSGDESGRYDLRRSLPGYRKACRMLRRSGRRIPRNADQRWTQAFMDSGPPVNDLAATLDLPSFLGIERANYPGWAADSEVKPFTAADFERAVAKWTK